MDRSSSGNEIPNVYIDGVNQSLTTVVSGNHTVKEIINIIKHKIPNLKIAFVEHKIMNQLSYEVSNQKTLNTGFIYNGNIRQGVNDTLKVLHNQLN